MRKIMGVFILSLIVFCLSCGNLGAQYEIPGWLMSLVADIALYPDQYVMGIGNASTPTPIINFSEKRFQTNIIFVPLVGWFPALGALGFDGKYKIIPEGEIMPEINAGAGYWNWFLLYCVKGEGMDASMWGYNVNAMITKTTAEKIRQHIGIQYSRTEGGITMATIGGTSTIPSSISLRTEKFDLLTGVDYLLSPKSTAYFLVGYDFIHSEVFERIGFAFGDFIVQIGIYPGSKFSIIPSLEWALSF